MKRFILILFVALLMAQFAAAKYVSGYYRSNGTYVHGYYRNDAGKSSSYSGYNLYSSPTHEYKSPKTRLTPKRTDYYYSWSPPSVYSLTYRVGGTTYSYTQTYESTGRPKVIRSRSIIKKFLALLGFSRTPAGYEVDHVVPLSQGGPDEIWNLQLLPAEVHHHKTAQERRRK